MTPEPTDLLRGAGLTLSDIVLPALADPFAIEQLKTVLRVLTPLEAVVDEAYTLEAGEAEGLREFLGEGEDAREAALTPYRELRDANVRRKRLVSDAIRARGRTPALEALVRRQLEREKRWTSPRRPSK